MNKESTIQPRRILASYTEDTIRVYQAYNAVIAEEAVRLGTFGCHFSMKRMTWIKPSFLWMMYRCGWAEKDDNQSHVLAIDIRREGFEQILQNAVLSSYHEAVYGTQEQWQERRARASVVCQWDPDRDNWGNPLPRRAIQLGLKNEIVEQYVRDWIVSVTDITPQVRAWKQRLDADETQIPELPAEREYPVSEQLQKHLGME